MLLNGFSHSNWLLLQYGILEKLVTFIQGKPGTHWTYNNNTRKKVNEKRYNCRSCLSNWSQEDGPVCFTFEPISCNDVTPGNESDHVTLTSDHVTGSQGSDMDEEEMEDELRTPKVFFSGPRFLMPNIRDPDLSCRQVKDRVERALLDHQQHGAVGSAYLQVPMNVPRRRHSWICG